MNTTDHNIASHLVRRAAERPYAAAVIYPHGHDSQRRVSYTHLTYRQLDSYSNRIAAALDNAGVEPGQRCAVMVTVSLDFFAITFALFKLGAVPVLIDPGMGIKNIKTCLAEAQPQVFIGVTKAHLARLIMGWGKDSIRLNITTAAAFWRDCVSLRALCSKVGDSWTCHQPGSDDIAAILFTSGSTGVPKGAVYSYANFNAQIDALRRLYAIEPGEIDLCTFPLFALFAPALGMTAVIPDMDATRPARVNPQHIFTAIDDFGVTNMFGSPALLRRVAAAGTKQQRRLPTLKRVISAGAPVSADILEQFSAMLDDDSAIHTPYGATEALPVCSVDSTTILTTTRHRTENGAGVYVGKPVDSIELHIISICDSAIAHWDDGLCVADGTIGEICVRGPQVTAAYFNRPESTALGKIACADGGFIHRMGDVGYRDKDGGIWFCGRKSHRVQTVEGTMFTIPCEAVFNTHAAVYRTALVGIGSAPKQTPVLCVELHHYGNRRQRAKVERELRAIAARFEHTRSIQHILFHRCFPVDIRHNAKIFREKLALWAQKKLG